jgi:TRAP-type C4-dicarboxylate transport system permease large subunit
MPTFKRNLFLSLCSVALLVSFMPAAPPASPGSGVLTGLLLLLVASMSVPGWHVEWVARLISLPFVVVLGVKLYEGFQQLSRGELRIEDWNDVSNVLLLVVSVYVFGTVLLEGRLPRSVTSIFTKSDSKTSR